MFFIQSEEQNRIVNLAKVRLSPKVQSVGCIWQVDISDKVKFISIQSNLHVNNFVVVNEQKYVSVTKIVMTETKCLLICSCTLIYKCRINIANNSTCSNLTMYFQINAPENNYSFNQQFLKGNTWYLEFYMYDIIPMQNECKINALNLHFSKQS